MWVPQTNISYMPATILWQCPFKYPSAYIFISCLPQQMNIHFSNIKLVDQFVV